MRKFCLGFMEKNSLLRWLLSDVNSCCQTVGQYNLRKSQQCKLTALSLSNWGTSVPLMSFGHSMSLDSQLTQPVFYTKSPTATQKRKDNLEVFSSVCQRRCREPTETQSLSQTQALSYMLTSHWLQKIAWLSLTSPTCRVATADDMIKPSIKGMGKHMEHMFQAAIYRGMYRWETQNHNSPFPFIPQRKPIYRDKGLQKKPQEAELRPLNKIKLKFYPISELPAVLVNFPISCC